MSMRFIKNIIIIKTELEKIGTRCQKQFCGKMEMA